MVIHINLLDEGTVVAREDLIIFLFLLIHRRTSFLLDTAGFFFYSYTKIETLICQKGNRNVKHRHSHVCSETYSILLREVRLTLPHASFCHGRPVWVGPVSHWRQTGKPWKGLRFYMNHSHIIITVFYYSLVTHGNNATVLTTQTTSHLKKRFKNKSKLLWYSEHKCK